MGNGKVTKKLLETNFSIRKITVSMSENKKVDFEEVKFPKSIFCNIHANTCSYLCIPTIWLSIIDTLWKSVLALKVVWNIVNRDQYKRTELDDERLSRRVYLFIEFSRRADKSRLCFGFGGELIKKPVRALIFGINFARERFYRVDKP